MHALNPSMMRLGFQKKKKPQGEQNTPNICFGKLHRRLHAVPSMQLQKVNLSMPAPVRQDVLIRGNITTLSELLLIFRDEAVSLTIYYSFIVPNFLV